MSRYLCPVCRAPRKTELRDELSAQTHFKIASTTFAVSALSYLAGGWVYAWQALFLYLPLWAMAEFVHWVKMREAAKCKACGFDPILYKRDWKAARRKVEDRLNGVVAELKGKNSLLQSTKSETPTQTIVPTAAPTDGENVNKAAAVVAPKSLNSDRNA